MIPELYFFLNNRFYKTKICYKIKDAHKDFFTKVQRVVLTPQTWRLHSKPFLNSMLDIFQRKRNFSKGTAAG
jgi:hypothetical protein